MLKRRDFLKAAAAAGLAVMVPWEGLGRGRKARAQETDPYEGTFFIMVHAGGGWDPTSLCDPKGRANEDAENPVNMYFTGDIGTAGNIKYAPVEGHQAFFDKYSSQLYVVNGIDMATNSHDAGTRNMWSGRLQEGHPGFAALYASIVARDKPMAFITNGGYDYAANLVALTRMNNVGAFERVAFPDRIDTNDENQLYHPLGAQQRIQQFQRERLEAQMERQGLPQIKRAMNELYVARQSDNELKRLKEFLPDELADGSMQRQAQLAMAAYQAGLAASVNMTVGGFDTHGNHDNNHYPRLATLLQGVDFIWQEAESRGIADKIVVCIGSDFGRTPYYNDGNGKDHWSITSMMFMGKGIPGNKVVGATDAGFKARTVNPQTLAVDDAGVRITPEHIHRALRKLAGITDAETAQRFPLYGEDLPLFT